MVLALYFFRRFFRYFILINTLLTLLFNFIEFFEKIARVKNATTCIVLHFITLNIVPSFFSNFPIASWLATCLFLKELAQQNELETFAILNIKPQKLFNLFFMAGITLSIISFIGTENISLKLQNKAEKFKLEKFKQNSNQLILNKWLTLPNINAHDLCYFQSLDLKNNKGTDLLLFYMSDDFIIQKTITAKSFKTSPKTNTVQITKGSIIHTKDSNLENIDNLNLELPSFFSQVNLSIEIPTLFLITQTLITQKNILPRNLWYNLLKQLLKRMLLHLQVIIYPLLTFCFFFILPYDNKYKWLLMLIPYPLIMLLFTISEIVSYPLLILTIIMCKKRLEKTY